MTVAGLETAGLEAVGLDVVGLVTEGLVCVPLNPSCMTPLSAVTTFLSLMVGVDLLTEELFLTADLTAEVVALSYLLLETEVCLVTFDVAADDSFRTVPMRLPPPPLRDDEVAKILSPSVFALGPYHLSLPLSGFPWP